MSWVGEAAQVRERDRRLIEDVGVPGIALMELAAAGVARVIRAHHAADAAAGVLVACGSGNNGGDGWAVARWLHQWGCSVRVWSLGAPRSDDAQRMAQSCRALGVPEVRGLDGTEGLLVDAVFGTGLGRPVEGSLGEALQALDEHPAPVVAVDLPSGLHADRGVALGACPTASCTVALGALKLGYFGADAARCGRLELVDLGFGATDLPPAARLLGVADLTGQWPARGLADHKTRSGHLLVVAGSLAMAGAAVLTCRGALAAGAGLVTLAAPRSALPRLAALPPEVMVLAVDDDAPELPSLDRFTALAAGPGLGGGGALAASWRTWLRARWGQGPPAVYDADALEATHDAPAADERVLTPHPGEAARLLGQSIGAVQADRFAAVRALAARGTALLKGPHTLVATPSTASGPPSELTINPTGAPTLATGGSGDVLTGVIGALLARGVTAPRAARLGAWVHGTAGERLAERASEGWTAADVAAEIPVAVSALRG